MFGKVKKWFTDIDAAFNDEITQADIDKIFE